MNHYFRSIVVILLSVIVINCSSLSVKNNANFEVSNYIDNNVAQIPVNINQSNNIIFGNVRLIVFFWASY